MFFVEHLIKQENAYNIILTERDFKNTGLRTAKTCSKTR